MRFKNLVRSSSLIGVSALAVLSAHGQVQAQVRPLYGDVKPFYGNLDPFYGNIDPFYGNINPFYGNIAPFWGNIDPFYGNIDPFYGNIDPFWGNLNPFYGNIDPFYTGLQGYWENFGAFWGGTQPLWSDATKASELALKLDDMIKQTEATWGSVLQLATGKTFGAGVGAELFARHRVDPRDGATLQMMSTEQRAKFLLDWYDTLMGYSGRDRIDHWMATVRWSPSITQQQGSGGRSLIGVLDARLVGDADVVDNVAASAGSTATVQGHGVGVASLIVGAHDNKGVMGIAPNARVVSYNPFDRTSTATWDMVKQGAAWLGAKGASVANMSLGVSGYTLHPDWQSVFFNAEVAGATRGKTAFVIAAGNDGASQTQNLAWNFSMDPALIVVGSVDVAGNISTFSNRPGSACLLSGTVCQEQLANRFIVAPGELMIVADGSGGVARRSGTSFAAPLVSGAITLLHDRWPWLRSHPKETVDIILSSARDLGERGTDPVYGRGLLDVTASQSPLNLNNLKFYEVRNGVTTQRSAADVRSGGIKSSWEAEGVYFHLYETIGSTYRDFTVPLSTTLSGKVGTLSGGTEYFQRFVEKRLRDWISGTAGSFTDVASYTVPTPAGVQFSFSSTSPELYLSSQGYAETPHSAVSVRDPATGVALVAGFGEGAMALAGEPGFGLSTDYDHDGGVNPLLGLASGGAFAGLAVPLGSGTTLSFGLTRQLLSHERVARSDEQRAAYRGVDAYEAAAINLKVSHQLGTAAVMSVAYTRVDEGNGLLGVQSRLGDLREGAISETATFSTSFDLKGGLTIAASATAGRSRTGEAEQGFSTAGGGVLSTAFAVAATKQGLVADSDMVRLSIAQPLHVEKGRLGYTGVEVIDRETGELGSVTRFFEITDRTRRYSSELLYAAPLMKGAGELGLFGRAELNGSSGSVDDFAIGTRLSIDF